MPRFLDRLLDLGPADDPRRVAVGGRPGVVRTVDRGRGIPSTPGARVQVQRPRGCRDGEVQMALLWLVRAGVAVELLEADEPGILLDGRRVSLGELRDELGARG